MAEIKPVQKVIVKTLAKGKDGATWYSGYPSDIPYCKAGDFCFNAETFDISHCVSGGDSNSAEWEVVCNLDVSGQIDRLRSDYSALLESLSDIPAFCPWWFGTRNEYNAMTAEERNGYSLHFIEEGS